ncbi:hypothetical protein [Afipia carboxidovorans]|uniref:hypothetical protein n=1 Tax=Afipia carboxidovorans TaxID=40137 RepID=UPI0030860A0F|nr:hypothetical protein CRBSH125_13810 [Afipia carboxidovorans]
MIEQNHGEYGNRAAGIHLLLALAPAAMLLVLLLRRVWDVDIFWQLKLGELILDNGGPLPVEPFAALHIGEPLPAMAWAGQAAMAFIRRIGGWDFLRVFDAACWLGGFGAVAVASRLRGASLLAVAIALSLAVLTALPTASIRPQSFGCLCFGLLLVLQRLELKPVLAIILGAPLLIAWQNLHPSVSVGVAAMGFATLPGVVGWLRGRSALPVVPMMLGLIGVAAIFATPDGASIIATSATNAQMSVAIGASEWLPLWTPHNRHLAMPIVVVALLTGWLVTRYRRFDPVEIAIALGLGLMTLMAYRFVLFWAVAMVPVIARAVAPPVARPERSEAVTVLASLLLVAVATPLLVPTRFAESLPLAAVQSLRDHQIRGTVYGDFRFGGVIIDTGYPDWRVTYDGRYYRYSSEEWRYNSDIENGTVLLADVVRKWSPAAFVLDERRNAPIAEELARSTNWQRIYTQDNIVAYVPRTAPIQSRTND